MLGVTVWDRQAEILRAVAEHRQTAVRSGHKVGKSTSAACLALWWATTRPRGRVVLTAPSGHQVRNILWPEVRRLYRDARYPLGGTCSPSPSRGLELPGDRSVICVTTDEPEKLAGLSGAELLFVVDEASGFPEPLWDPIHGNMAGGGRVVALGNPTRTSGTFYEAFGNHRQWWRTIHISSEESPNVRAGRMLIPGLATREWVDARREEWGSDSPAYHVRVRGDFPAQAENAVISLALVEAALERGRAQAGDIDHHGITLGVDVARFGDDSSVIQPVIGRRALPAVIMQGADTQVVAARVLACARRLGGGTPVRVHIDGIGVGAGVVDTLRLAGPAVEVVDVNVSEVAQTDDHRLLRDQLWFGLRDWLRDGAIPDDPLLVGELVAPTYSFDARGRFVVESKDALKKRLRRSPDRADALALAVYSAPRIQADLEAVTVSRRGSMRSLRDADDDDDDD